MEVYEYLDPKFQLKLRSTSTQVFANSYSFKPLPDRGGCASVRPLLARGLKRVGGAPEQALRQLTCKLEGAFVTQAVKDICVVR